MNLGNFEYFILVYVQVLYRFLERNAYELYSQITNIFPRSQMHLNRLIFSLCIVFGLYTFYCFNFFRMRL